ncbi:non-homologous end-joining DNA ligase [Salsipaludibacter albus]|uniref:non-homologous end-joining DNA ligase n=1 Tax=Salsipaludibacter albus TaxID=2849650 RepID=UPI0030846C21
MAERVTVTVDDRRLRLSNLDKVLYPSTGTTKAAVIDYYTRVADVMLPHLRDRPLTMVRYPDGVEGDHFFEKRCPPHHPDWLPTVDLGRIGRDKVVAHCDLRERAALVWAANLAALELHVPMGRAPDPHRPTMVVFDLDPGPPAGIVESCVVAGWLFEVFDRLGLEAFAKTSGSKGLQVYVPVNSDDTTYDETKEFARSVGRLLERVHPDLVLTSMDRSARTGKVFVDWSQNVPLKTTVAVYSLRARDTPTVSTPVTRDEVETAARRDTVLAFTADEVLLRIDEQGDLFAPTLTLEQQLPALGTS